MSASVSNNNSSSSNNILTDRYPLPMHLYGRFTPNFLLFDRVATPIWYALGLIGNSLSAIVWLSPDVRRNNSSAVYLSALSLWDLAFLALHTFQELKEAWNVSQQNLFTCTFLPVLLLTAQYLSPLLVLGFTVERWLSVCFPFRRESMCTTRRAGTVVACMTVCVLLWNLWQLRFKVGCEVPGDAEGWMVYTLVTEALVSGLVPAAALVFNLLVVREIRRISTAGAERKTLRTTTEAVEELDVEHQRAASGSASERRYRTTTVTLLSVSFFVILTTLPAGMVYGLQTFAEFGSVNMTDAQVLADDTWQRHFAMTRIKKVIDEASISHYSLNFFIYLATGPQYRRRLAEIFCRLWRHLLRLLLRAAAATARGADGTTAESATERRLASSSLRRSRRAKAEGSAAAKDQAATSGAADDEVCEDQLTQPLEEFVAGNVEQD